MLSVVRISRRLLALHLFNASLVLLNFYIWTFPRSPALPAATQLLAPVQRTDTDRIIAKKPEEDYNGVDQKKVDQEEVVLAWRNSSGIPAGKRLPESKTLKDLVVKQKRVHRKTITANDTEIFISEYRVPRINRTNLVDCAAVLRGNEHELEKADRIMMTKPKVPIPEETYLEWTKNCDEFKRHRGYIEVPTTREEQEYPLAFSIAMFADIEQSERLLRAVYQPQNFYCVHVDTKSPLLLHQAMSAVADCFDNVWISTRLDKIKWGDVTVVLLDVNCMRDMVKYHRGKYKYFINLTGQEFPLRTNLEIVRIAKIFNGSNDIGGSTATMDLERVNYRWTHRWSKTYQQTIFYRTNDPHPPYHINLTFFKGELHGLFSRGMTEYIVESEHGRKYLEWCKDTGHPSEHYYNTLNYNEHLRAPGGYTGPLDAAQNYSTHPAIRIKNWVNLYDKLKCFGKVVRGICIYSLRDAAWLAGRNELFANKFRLTYEYLGLDCLEERHRNRTMSRSLQEFNEEYYRALPTVLYGRKDGI